MDVFVVLRTPAYRGSETYVVGVYAKESDAKRMILRMEVSRGDRIHYETHPLKTGEADDAPT